MLIVIYERVTLNKITLLNAEAKRIEDYPFLENTGEMGDLILKYDWSKTCLGPLDQWPVSLRITLGNILHSGFPMFLWWGEDMLCFYNEAYRPSLGENGRHPGIGKKAIAMWGDIWHVIGPQIQQVMLTRKSVTFEDQLVPFHRNGKMEEIYWTYTYSPAYGEGDKIFGVLVTCMETTKAVLARKDKEEKA